LTFRYKFLTDNSELEAKREGVGQGAADNVIDVDSHDEDEHKTKKAKKSRVSAYISCRHQIFHSADVCC
jgi:hypothetical protein